MILKYNDDKCIATKIYNANNEIETIYGNISQTQYGLLSSLNSYDASGKFIMSFANEYDRIYQVGSTAKDSLGKLTSEVKINLTAKKYPERILEVTYLKDSKTRKLFSYKYELWDENDNWIKKNVFDDKGDLIQIVRRFFSYR